MLVLFRFKNYGPFKDEVAFDMRAIKAYKEHPYYLINGSNRDSLLKVASIYGANASGKSNFVDAYHYFRTIVSRSFQANNTGSEKSFLSHWHFPFFFDEATLDGDTEFEAVYYLDDNEYKYGFIYDSEKIKYEWLYKKSLKTNRTIPVIERDLNQIELGASVKKSCEKYLADIDDDVLALSFFSSLKLRTSVFKEVNYCVQSILPVSFSGDTQTDDMLEYYFAEEFDEDEKENLLAFLSAIDVGIKDVTVQKNKKDTLVYTSHAGKNDEMYAIPLELESDGTRRAITIYSLLRTAMLLEKGLIIDEFNNQLHPLLQKYLISLFCEANLNGQLIYTTHDTTFLDKQYMRRDQIWFTEKDENGESSLFSLAEFKVRNDKPFGKDYLGGVYGGIPMLKDFSFKENENGNG